MKRTSVDIEKFSSQVFKCWNKDWFLLTAGDFASRVYNCMVVGWGSFGTMWNLPFVQVLVRPVRHTHKFMEKFETFTVSGFPAQYRAALQMLGSTSGKDCDKIAKAGLTPTASTKVAAPSFAEASLVIECRKIYKDTIDPAGFLASETAGLYPAHDYHTVYFGQVLAITEGK